MEQMPPAIPSKIKKVLTFKLNRRVCLYMQLFSFMLLWSHFHTIIITTTATSTTLPATTKTLYAKDIDEHHHRHRHHNHHQNHPQQHHKKHFISIITTTQPTITITTATTATEREIETIAAQRRSSPMEHAKISSEAFHFHINNNNNNNNNNYINNLIKTTKTKTSTNKTVTAAAATFDTKIDAEAAEPTKIVENKFDIDTYTWTGARISLSLKQQQENAEQQQLQQEEEEEENAEQQQQQTKPQDLWLSSVNKKNSHKMRRKQQKQRQQKPKRKHKPNERHQQQQNTIQTISHKTKSGLLIESNIDMDFSSSTITPKELLPLQEQQQQQYQSALSLVYGDDGILHDAQHQHQQQQQLKDKNENHDDKEETVIMTKSLPATMATVPLLTSSASSSSSSPTSPLSERQQPLLPFMSTSFASWPNLTATPTTGAAAAAAVATASALAPVQNRARKHNRPQHKNQNYFQQQQQQQREHRAHKRNGRVGQRQKLQRNALRLLNNLNDNNQRLRANIEYFTRVTESNIIFKDFDSNADGAFNVDAAGDGANAGTGGGLFPQLFNVAMRATITVNGTCGQNGREEYCKLVDAYPHKKWATQCGICNAHSSDIEKHRPITAVLTNTIQQQHNLHDSSFSSPSSSLSSSPWWQSPTLQKGHHFEYITITLDLKQVYQVFYVMLRSANSPRPASWILERSVGGIHFEAWQYFGRSEADCRQRYGLAAQNGKYMFKNDSEVICSVQFSKALPLENGELHVSLLKNRPGAMNQSNELMDFIRARFIRIRLQGMHSTANLDNSVYWQLDAQSLEKRSFYSLRQIRISGRLDCHGHADKTFEYDDGINAKLQCVCQHNTCGEDCSECCPLFRDKAFRSGTTMEANQCEICQCNGHADSCTYDAFLGGGICNDCHKYTTGNECELCLPGYYRVEGASPTEPCHPCECNVTGSNGDCQPNGGACICKMGFQGKHCEECLPGYYGDNCKKCECDTRGTLANTECSGTCLCRQNVHGETCNTCKPGYYDLSTDNENGCTSCWCSGLNVTCTSAEISTLAFETLNDWLITDLKRSQTAQPSLDGATNFLVYGMYEISDVEAIYWQAPIGYLGNRLASYGSRISVQLQWVTIRGDTSGKPTSGPNIILFGRNGMKIAYGDEQFTKGSSATINITLAETGWYHVPNDVTDIKTRLRRTEYHGSPVTREQFLSVLSMLDALLIRAAFHTDQIEVALERAVIYTGGTELGGLSSTRVEKCFCPPGYTGLSCESCDFGHIRTMENSSNHLLMARCKPCPCNGHSDSCDLQSGGCGNCMHNTYGERCERCLRGFYGNPLQGTANDCKPCACPLLDASNNFSPSCQLKSYAIMDINPMYDGVMVVENSAYICTQCPQGYTGDHCEMCDDGYYGDPMVIGLSCKPCQCDGGGPCNVKTGECIICHGNTEGWHCERCKLGYWGDPAIGCEACSCHTAGSDSEFCDSTDGQCLCKPRYGGQKCNKCADGYTNITGNCQPCDCDKNGAIDPYSCDPDVGQCYCKIGVTGLKCDQCADMFYGLWHQYEQQQQQQEQQQQLEELKNENEEEEEQDVTEQQYKHMDDINIDSCLGK